MSRTLLLVALALASTSTACSKKEEKPEPEKVTAAPKPKKEAKKPKTPVVDQDLVRLSKSIKTEEDFERSVEQDIVPSNLEAEVDRLEKEIAPAEQ